jgi:hypothetical protein
MSTNLSLDITTYKAQAEPHISGLQTMSLAVNNLVVSEETYQAAVDLRNNLIDRENALKALWKRIKDPLNTLKNAIMAEEHATTDPITALKNKISGKINLYLEEAKKAKEEADKSLDRQVSQTKRTMAEEAEFLEACGKMDEAAEIRQQIASVVKPELPPAAPVAMGAKTTDKFEWEATDMMALIKAVASGEVDLMHEYKGGELRPLLTINQTVVNAVVARKGLRLGWPGIVVKMVTKIGRKA